MDLNVSVEYFRNTLISMVHLPCALPSVDYVDDDDDDDGDDDDDDDDDDEEDDHHGQPTLCSAQSAPSPSRMWMR